MIDEQLDLRILQSLVRIKAGEGLLCLWCGACHFHQSAGIKLGGNIVTGLAGNAAIGKRPCGEHIAIIALQRTFWMKTADFAVNQQIPVKLRGARIAQQQAFVLVRNDLVTCVGHAVLFDVAGRGDKQALEIVDCPHSEI